MLVRHLSSMGILMMCETLPDLSLGIGQWDGETWQRWMQPDMCQWGQVWAAARIR